MRNYLYLSLVIAFATYGTPVKAQNSDICAATEVQETEVDVPNEDGIKEAMDAAGQDPEARKQAAFQYRINVNGKSAAAVIDGFNSIKDLETQIKTINPGFEMPAEVSATMKELSDEYLGTKPGAKIPFPKNTPEYAEKKMERFATDPQLQGDFGPDQEAYMVKETNDENAEFTTNNGKLTNAVQMMAAAARAAAGCGEGAPAGGAPMGGEVAPEATTSAPVPTEG